MSGNPLIPYWIQSLIVDWHIFWPRALSTFGHALAGVLIASALALVAAFIGMKSPKLEASIIMLGLAAGIIPVVILAPILDACLSSGQLCIALAAFNSFFSMLLTGTIAARSQAAPFVEAFWAFGARNIQVAWIVFGPFVVARVVSGLTISWPAALAGTMLGEFVSADQGIGGILVLAEQSANELRVFDFMLLTAGLSLGLYLLLSLAIGVLEPRLAHVETYEIRAGGPYGLRDAGFGLLALIVAWYCAVLLAGAQSFSVKGPLQLVRYLLQPASGGKIVQLLAATGTSMGEIAGALVAGAALAVGTFVCVRLVPAFRVVVAPVFVASVSVPFVTYAPLIALFFHRGGLAALTFGTVLCFNGVYGILDSQARDLPEAMRDWFRVFGGKPLRILLLVDIPHYLQVCFCAWRTALPGAITGVLAGEWLVTGKGVGYFVFRQVALYDFNAAWLAVITMTTLGVGLLMLLMRIETVVLSYRSATRIAPQFQ